VTDPAERLRQTRLRARTFASRLEEIAEDFVDRDEVMRVLGLATLCREHVLLIGPPGTAKTLLVDKFRRMLDVQYFSYLLTRFTEPAEIFGPMDVRHFRRGTFRINTDGMLPQAHLAFLDEVFQGSSAILNSLLTLINERRFHNGPEVVDVPLLSLLGSTNELPDDVTLAAFSDRFLLRVRLDYVGPDQIDQVLTVGWGHERDQAAAESADGIADAGEARFGLDELKALQREVTRIDLGPVREQLTQTLRVLRHREGVVMSDRRAVKAQKLIAASALLDARPAAELRDLSVLSYLWTRQSDEDTIRRVLAELDVPMETRPRQRRDTAAIRRELNRLGAAEPGTRAESRERVRRLHELSLEAARDHRDDASLVSDIKDAHGKAVTALRDRFEEGTMLHV
jgi:MoxR-like ATPase